MRGQKVRGEEARGSLVLLILEGSRVGRKELKRDNTLRRECYP